MTKAFKAMNFYQSKKVQSFYNHGCTHTCNFEPGVIVERRLVDAKVMNFLKKWFETMQISLGYEFEAI
jgi:hypothetical protein